MAIKVLGRTSVIIRRDAIEQKIAGGWDAFFRHIELGICCGEVLYDDYLVAIHRRWVGLEAVKEFATLGLLLWEWDWDNFRTIEWIDGCLVTGNGHFPPTVWPVPCPWLSIMPDDHAVRLKADTDGIVRSREDCVHMSPEDWMRTH